MHTFARSIVDTVRHPLLVLNDELRVVAANEPFYRTFATAPPSTLGHRIYDLGEGRWDLPPLRDQLERLVLSNEHLEGLVVDYDSPTDGVRHLVLNVRWVNRDQDPAPMLLLAIEDETDKRRAAAALRASEALFRAVVERSFDAVTLADSNAIIRYLSPACERIDGRTPAQHVGHHLFAFCSPDEAPEHHAAFRELVARPGATATWRGRCVRPDGATRDLESVVTNLLDEADIRAVVLNTRDVTDRMTAESGLRRARTEAERMLARLRAVIASMNEGVIISDAAGTLLDWNGAAARLLGYATPDEVRRPLSWFATAYEVSRPGGPPLPASEWPMARVLRGERLSGLELHIRRADTGKELFISYGGVPVFGPSGEVELGVLTLNDITERRRMEDQIRQAQKMEAVGRLAGGIAHDFNNLLTIINGYSDLLLEQLPPDDSRRDLVAEVHRAGERSAGLTRQLLAFSRQQVLDPKVLDLNAVITELSKMLRRVIGEDVLLVVVPGTELWPVRADPGQVEQVLMNLCVNARDAMPRGGRLTIETQNVELGEAYAGSHADSRSGPHVLLAVSDTGTGMTDDVRNRVFDPFFTTKGPGKGTGLGLATVHGIVKQSGGHVGVYSEVGIGTTFKVYLPRSDAADGPAAPAGSDLGLTHGTETVLVVEDEQGVRALASRVLSSYGYTVLTAANGEEALELVAGHNGEINLLVTDVVMPELDGRQVATRLVDRYPALRVLYVSGYTDDAVIRHGVLWKGVHFLQKPFAPVLLAQKVREVLDAPLTDAARGAQEE